MGKLASISLAAALAAAGLAAPALSAPVAPEAEPPTPSGLPVPRFVSLKFATVNGRSGPSEAHPILWVYHREGLPVEVVAETENWRRVRDPDGVLVWMHKRTLDGRLTALVTEEAALYRQSEIDDSDVVAVAEPGVVVEVRACRDGWGRVSVDDYTGWVLAERLWGGDCGTAPAPQSPETPDPGGALASAD